MTDTTSSTPPAGEGTAPAAGSKPRRASGLSGMLLPELKQMAGGLGIKGAGAMRKSQLVDAIKAAQSGGQSASGPSSAPGARPVPGRGAGPVPRWAATRVRRTARPRRGSSSRRLPRPVSRTVSRTGRRDSPGRSASAARRSRRRTAARASAPRLTAARATTGASAATAPRADRDQATAPRTTARRRPHQQPSDDRNKGGDRTQTDRDQGDRDRSQGGDRDHGNQGERDRGQGERDRNQDNRGQNDNRNQAGQGNQQNRRATRAPTATRTTAAAATGVAAAVTGTTARRPRGQPPDNRPTTGATSGSRGSRNEPDTTVLEDDVLVPAAGILDVLDNYAFVRTSGYLPGSDDVYVSLSMVRKFGLRRGDAVTGQVRQPREGERKEKFNPMVRIDTINGADPEAAKGRVEFQQADPALRLRAAASGDRVDAT